MAKKKVPISHKHFEKNESNIFIVADLFKQGKIISQPALLISVYPAKIALSKMLHHDSELQASLQ